MYIESELVSIAKRENNPKRNYLVVNRLQGKHIPVSPQRAFALFDALAERVKGAFGQEALLLAGFAETATAIGARLAVKLGAGYIQTTREQIPGAEYLLFLESHSHATEQKVVKNGLEEILSGVGRMVFVEDEVTTGNTILHIIDLLEREYPGKVKYAVASILNGMDSEAEERYRRRQIDFLYLVKTDHAGYAKTAELYAGDGRYLPADVTPHPSAEQYPLHTYLNARRYVQGEAYGEACASLWRQAKKLAGTGGGKRILVLGTEEFMYPALYVGSCLERCGNTVKCHATTRSPIAVSSEADYPVHCRYELESLYEEGRRTFVYDLAQYDSVWILTDANPLVQKGADSLVNALRRCGNEDIKLFCWR